MRHHAVRRPPSPALLTLVSALAACQPESNGDAATCPMASPELAFAVRYTWDGPEPDALSVDCTVTRFEPGAVQRLELTCLHPGEMTPRTHGVDVTLPPGIALAVAEGDAVRLEHGYTPSPEMRYALHTGLTCGEELVYLVGAAGSEHPSECVVEDSLLARFADRGMTLVRGTCPIESSDRVEFTIGGETVSLWHQSSGTLPDGSLAIIAQAQHYADPGVVVCGYELMLVTPAG